jgi:hypothetical protein
VVQVVVVASGVVVVVTDVMEGVLVLSGDIGGGL